MGTVTGQSVGIDIGEDFLDVYLHPAGKEVRLPHDDEGPASLLALLRGHEIGRVVLQHRGAETAAGPVPPGGGVCRQRGQPGDEQIAAMAGVAPHSDEGGKDRGRARIRGGRPRVRARRSMAVFNAREDNPVIKAFYARRVGRGEASKQAMTACMRKPSVPMNTPVARAQHREPSLASGSPR